MASILLESQKLKLPIQTLSIAVQKYRVMNLNTFLCLCPLEVSECSLMNKVFQTVNTVKPPLTDTSQQWPLFYFPADGPCILFYFNLSTMATSPQQLQPLKSLPTAKITS